MEFTVAHHEQKPLVAGKGTQSFDGGVGDMNESILYGQNQFPDVTKMVKCPHYEKECLEGTPETEFIVWHRACAEDSSNLKTTKPLIRGALWIQ